MEPETVNYQSPNWEDKYMGIKERIEIEATRDKSDADKVNVTVKLVTQDAFQRFITYVSKKLFNVAKDYEWTYTAKSDTAHITLKASDLDKLKDRLKNGVFKSAADNAFSPQLEEHVDLHKWLSLHNFTLDVANKILKEASTPPVPRKFTDAVDAAIKDMREYQRRLGGSKDKELIEEYIEKS